MSSVVQFISRLLGLEKGKKPAGQAASRSAAEPQTATPGGGQQAGVNDVAFGGFQRSAVGLHLKCWDAARREVVTDAIARLSPIQPGWFLVYTVNGACFRLQLTPQQAAGFQKLLAGEACAPAGVAPATAVPNSVQQQSLVQARGFSKTEKGIHFRFTDSQQRVLLSSPVRQLDPLGNGWYAVCTVSGSVYRAHLTAAHLTEFQRCRQPDVPTARAVPQAPAWSPAQPTKPEPIAHRPSAARPFPPTGSQPSGKLAGRVSDLRPNCLTWLGANTTLVLGNWLLPEPLTYFSSGSSPQDDASCIDVRLQVGRPVQEMAGALGYWPHYRSMSPDQRANYLSWLSSGRNAPLNDIGYVFVFFYGLERRVLVDGQDLYPVLCEVSRLLERYPTSNSFNGYARSFIAFSLARAGVGTVSESWFAYLVEKPCLLETDSGRAVALAWMCQHEHPLPVPLAQQIALQDPLAQRSVVVDRVREQFDTLFTEKYRARFGEGLVLRAAKRDLSLPYHPGSPTLLSSRGAAEHLTARIPHVRGIESQFKPLIALWNECVEELRPLSRQVGKGVAVNSRAAYDALPEALKKATEHPDARRWQQAAAPHARSGGVALTPVVELAALLGLASGGKLTVRQSQEIAQVAHDVGLAIEPDARSTRRAYPIDDRVALFRLEGDFGVDAEQGAYPAAALVLELGLAMAAADGAVDPEEVSHVTHFIETQFELGLPQARRLEALKALLLECPPPLAGLGNRIQGLLDEEQRTALTHLLIGVAAANGKVDRAELSTLRKVGRALGVDAGRLEALLRDLLGTDGEPVEVRRGASGRAGEAIPARTSKEEAVEVILNEEILRSILQETQHVARMLTEAMAEEEAEQVDVVLPAHPNPSSSPAVVEVAPVEAADDGRFDGLDLRYHPIVIELLTRESWAAAEFEALARGHRLFPAGTMDVINEWAEERLGDVLLEEGDPLRVRRQLIEQ